MTQLSHSHLTKKLIEFKQEKRKTENFLKRNKNFLTADHKVIPDKAEILLQKEQNIEKILHPTTARCLDKIFILELKNIDLLINRFNDFYQKMRGLPPFIADFLQGKPSQEKEVFFKQPKQTSLVKCDDYHFLIQPTPSYNDFSLRDTDDKLMAYGQYTIPPRLCAWFIDNDYIDNKEKYPILEALCDKDKKTSLLDKYSRIHNKDKLALRYGEKNTPQRNFADSQETSPDIMPPHRRFSFSKVAHRNLNTETNQERTARTGRTYLSSVLLLESEKHLKMLKELKTKCLEYMDKTYGITHKTHPELDMYFHYPYLEKTSTLHLHITCKNISTDLKKIRLDDIISCFEENITVKDIVTKKYHEIGGLNFDPEPALFDELFNLIGHDNIIGGKIIFTPLDNDNDDKKLHSIS